MTARLPDVNPPWESDSITCNLAQVNVKALSRPLAHPQAISI